MTPQDEALEVCLGCGKPVADRDCGCPAGTGWVKKSLSVTPQDEARSEAEKAALAKMFEGWYELKRLGWNDAIYCPKDGSTFLVIEPGSTGIHKAHYEGEWPKGRWWVHEAGDLWPSRPCLWKPKAQP